eukprot:CAMPEP_0194479960 /NCGR_PEP_ID=MMETSP0253-20130528/2919_1 /TAXON_ID=2966 /ORGANISM="Noctiluca scintillans" /LENGTH=96 /DNA_ID=CAMNT_0039319269 /DNA_START=81 /DNA_END=371 /DNA_ORIENTATION=-
MATILEPMVGQTVSIITNDGRTFYGALKGFDQHQNMIMTECQERVYHPDAGVEQVVLGLYLIRGDNIAVIGEVDTEIDSAIDLRSIRAHPLKPVVH